MTTPSEAAAVRQLATARDICQWLHADPDTKPLRPSTLRVWVMRGRLTVHGHSGRWNLYDVDEVLTLVALRDTPSVSVD